MATVFMRWLETTARDYDRGIRLLTLGRLRRLKERIVAQHLLIEGEDPPRVLEIGCGTGTLAVMMARAGATVTAIDVSAQMLDEAERKAKEAGLEHRVAFHRMDVTELSQRFEGQSFDLIVSTLVFSELAPEVQRFALREISRLLEPAGRLLIVDETLPRGRLRRWLYGSIRLPLVVLTWLLTRTTTKPVSDLPRALSEAGFLPAILESALGGSLVMFKASRAPSSVERATPWEGIPRLQHRTTLKTVLLDVWSYLNRILPPYPKVATGLYRIGRPDRNAPVLVTGNYDLTVRRLVRALDGRAHCWLVVANSRGVNVWCGAGGGYFRAEDVISALRTSGVMEAVDHHSLILPQLCANGVDGWKIREQTGWGVRWGPVRADDIPAYLDRRYKKSDAMRQVSFPLKDRLEMTTAVMAFYALFALMAGLILWRSHTLLVLGLMILISYVYGVFLPWLPGKDGIGKGIGLAVLTLAGLWIWSDGWGHLEAASLFNWTLGLGFMAFFIGAEFQGMSPRMRGEQANWTIEGLVGAGTLAAYGIGRLVLGG